MKQIDIPCTSGIGKDARLAEVSAFLDKLERVDIGTQPWSAYPYKPEVTFSMAHSGDCLFIKFNVVEQFVQAIYAQNNDPVSQDSCVEFFVALGGGDDYYNFEFNCIATCKAAFGSKARKDRTNLPDHIIDQISRRVIITKGRRYHDGLVAWELIVAIPLQVFYYSNIPSFKGLEARGNFYKCGENLPQPHFIVWNEVTAAKPDFHLPEFFGKITFL